MSSSIKVLKRKIKKKKAELAHLRKERVNTLTRALTEICPNNSCVFEPFDVCLNCGIRKDEL